MQKRRVFLKIKRSMILTIFIIAITFSTLYLSLARAENIIGDNNENPEAVRKVLGGKQFEANAAWWGFDETDATDALQSAINSGAKKVVVPNMGKDWIVKPIQLKGKQEILFEDGVVVTAKKGEFKGKGDCLFKAFNCSNITLKGYGAVLRMQKKDYMSESYVKAEWRMVMAFYGCSNITVSGLTLKDSGGDGIYLGVTSEQRYCRDIHIRDVVCDNNYRQGISVISAENLLIENCSLKNTRGTPPAAGIDLEPNHHDERLKNCVIRNCTMEQNEGPGILVYLRPLSAESEDISIRFEDCRVTSRQGAGIQVGAVRDDGPDGLIEFRKCTIENTLKVGAQVYDKSSERARVRFTFCTWKNVANSADDTETPAPLWLYLRRPSLTKKHGGVDFINCRLEDNRNRPFLAATEKESSFGVFDITGRIFVQNPNDTGMKMDNGSEGVTLRYWRNISRE